MVMRDTQVSSPASLVSSICQTWVLRPMCTGRVIPVTQPLVAPLEPVHGLNEAALGCNRDEWADRARRMG